jgi:hypothetical protein
MIRIKPSKLTNRFGVVNERREKQKPERKAEFRSQNPESRIIRLKPQ